MGIGWSALVNYFGGLKLKLKAPWDDDGCDGEKLIAVAEEGHGPEVLKRKLKDPRDDDDSWDDGFDSDNWAELPAAAEKGVGPDILVSNRAKNPGLIRTNKPEPARADQVKSARADLEMGAVQKDLTRVINRSKVVLWIELYHAINKSNVDVLINGLSRDDKELLWYQDFHQDCRGETLLHAAVKAAGKGPLRKLVRFMTINRATEAAYLFNYNGDTALHLAVKKGDLDASNCLMKAEPKTVYQVNYKGVSPLYTAVKAGNHELIKSMVSYCCLRDHASDLLSRRNHATLAHLAIEAGSFGIFKVLMEHLPKLVKAKNEDGLRLLSYAAYKGSLDEVNYILTNFQKFARISDNDGCLPIHKAVGGGHVRIFKAFLKHCPQALYHVSKNGQSVLHIAAINDKGRIITYLTKKVKMDESFLNLKDYKGKTYMDYATDLKQ